MADKTHQARTRVKNLPTQLLLEFWDRGMKGTGKAYESLIGDACAQTAGLTKQQVVVSLYIHEFAIMIYKWVGLKHAVHTACDLASYIAS